MNIAQQVREIIAMALKIDPDQINNDSNMDNVQEWDSLGHFRLILQLENDFHITIDPDDIVKMIDYSNILKIVQRYLKKRRLI